MWRPFSISARWRSEGNRCGTVEQPFSKCQTHSQERLRNATSRLLAQLIPIPYEFWSCQSYHCRNTSRA